MAQALGDLSYTPPLVKYQELPSLPSEVRLETERKLSVTMSAQETPATQSDTVIRQWLTANAPSIIRDWLDANAESVLRASAASTHVVPTKRKPNDTTAPTANDDDTTNTRYSPLQRSRPTTGALGIGGGGIAPSHVSSATNEDDSVEPDPSANTQHATAPTRTRRLVAVEVRSRRRESVCCAHTVSLRMAQADRRRRELSSCNRYNQQAEPRGRLADPTCFLVEDVRVSQRIAAAALTRAHYKVEVASDGESAVDKYRQHSATLRIILMDIHLPGISGIEGDTTDTPN